MSSIKERINGLVAQRKEEERVRNEQTRAEVEKRVPLAHHLEVSKKTMKAIGAEDMLRDINKHFLGGKGKIEKAEGIFTHEAWATGHMGLDSYDYPVDCDHPVSWVSLQWPESIYNLGWNQNRLSVFIGTDRSDEIICKVKGGGMNTDEFKAKDVVASVFHGLRGHDVKEYDVNQEYDSLAEQVESGLAELFVK